MGRVTSKDNEAKSEMKQPSDMPMPRFEHGGSDLWSNTLLLDHEGAFVKMKVQGNGNQS